MLAATILLLRFAVQLGLSIPPPGHHAARRGQLPWLANLLYIAGRGPIAGLDLTPSAFALSGFMAAWSILRFQLLDLVPAARDALFDGMSDGVLVLDAQNRIVDINPAGRRLIGGSGRLDRRKYLGSIQRSVPDLIASYQACRRRRRNYAWRAIRRATWVCTSPRSSTGTRRLTGRSVVFSDITDRKQMDLELRQAKLALEAANQELADRLAELDRANTGTASR